MAEPQEEQRPGIGDEPAIDEAARNRVVQWNDRVTRAKTYWEPDFKRMRACMQIVRDGTDDKAWLDGGKYVVPIAQRHVAQKVAALYAKNPKVLVERRKKRLFQVWDGKPESLAAVLADPANPAGPMVLAEIAAAQQHAQLYDGIADTLVKLWDYYADEAMPNFKVSAKSAVRRALTTVVAYCEVGFQRTLEPGAQTGLADSTAQIQGLERRGEQIASGDIAIDDPQVDEARTMSVGMQAGDMIVREGLVFDWPRSTSIIPDPDTRQLKGWVGTGWLCREELLSADKVKEAYGVDVGQRFKAYKPDGKTWRDTGERGSTDRDKTGLVAVRRIWDKVTGEYLVVADGYPGYLKEPAKPVPHLERFFPIVPLTFNEVEDEDKVFHPSDVWNLRHAQNEYNRAKEGLREHRIANRPRMAVSKGAGMEQADRQSLMTSAANTVVEMAALAPNQKLEDLMQRVPVVPIDPALYETRSTLEDVMHGVGTTQPQIGGTSGDSATEASIAESRSTTEESHHVDDLDEFLSEVAEAAGQVMLLMMSADMVRRIVGPGAVWPEFSRADVIEELSLTTKAGSSGRPNKAAELANLERGMPLVIQLPGSAGVAQALLDRYLTLLDIDVEGAALEGLPSILAVNAAAGRPQPSTGDPATDPNAQGAQGGDNAAQPPGQAPGAQPAYPVSVDETQGGMPVA